MEEKGLEHLIKEAELRKINAEIEKTTAEKAQIERTVNSHWNKYSQLYKIVAGAIVLIPAAYTFYNIVVEPTEKLRTERDQFKNEVITEKQRRLQDSIASAQNELTQTKMDLDQKNSIIGLEQSKVQTSSTKLKLAKAEYDEDIRKFNDSIVELQKRKDSLNILNTGLLSKQEALKKSAELLSNSLDSAKKQKLLYARLNEQINFLQSNYIDIFNLAQGLQACLGQLKRKRDTILVINCFKPLFSSLADKNRTFYNDPEISKNWDIDWLRCQEYIASFKNIDKKKTFEGEMNDVIKFQGSSYKAYIVAAVEVVLYTEINADYQKKTDAIKRGEN